MRPDELGGVPLLKTLHALRPPLVLFLLAGVGIFFVLKPDVKPSPSIADISRTHASIGSLHAFQST